MTIQNLLSSLLAGRSFVAHTYYRGENLYTYKFFNEPREISLEKKVRDGLLSKETETYLVKEVKIDEEGVYLVCESKSKTRYFCLAPEDRLPFGVSPGLDYGRLHNRTSHHDE